MDYKNELILSLKRENALLRKLAREDAEVRVEIAKEFSEGKQGDCVSSMVGQIFVYPFKDGNDYEIQVADDNGTLVFVDAIFESEFDDKEDWSECTNKWEDCTLKKKLEDWWDKNAPDDLKSKYRVTMLAANQILPDEMLPSDLKGKGGQLELFKDWKNRIKRLRGEQRSTWYWTISPNPDVAYGVWDIYPSGVLSGDPANYSGGVVPACIPIE